jgi:CheY-like chemotaxis protein
MRQALIIDDIEDIREVIAFVLKGHGFVTSVAASGEQGVALATELLPDIVLCDIRMPDISGDEVVFALKSQSATSRIPILFVSGSCEHETEHTADGFLQKPFGFDELVEKVNQLIAAAHALPS